MARQRVASEPELVAAFAAGEEWAVRWVYEHFAGPVMTVAMSILRRRDLADEAVQATLVKAWRASSTFDTSRELAPWLYAIARRTAIDILRRERRVEFSTFDDAAANLTVTPLTFERTWEAWEVRRALEQLPAIEREVVAMSHLEQMTHPEIAEHLGVPLGTVKSRSGRAHKRLAELLQHLGPDSD